MSEREEFVARYLTGHESMATLARTYGISRKTGYKWVRRAQAGEPLTDQSRRPHTSPRRSTEETEAHVLAVRATHPTWGARKIHHYLHDHNEASPAPSTIHQILRRHGVEPRSHTQAPFIRYEQDAPNDRWQIDFKGWHPLRSGRVYPLTVLDDHSRFLLGITCLEHQTFTGVQAVLTRIFQTYGLPWGIQCDNGIPWGNLGVPSLTRFGVWLMQLDVDLIHSRPFHPQTNGKLERFHRTLKADVFAGHTFVDLADAQRACQTFRTIYNLDRPHEALNFDRPVRHYATSPRSFPDVIAPPEYADDALVRTVGDRGHIRLHGHRLILSKGLIGHQVGVYRTTTDGVFRVVFYRHDVATIDLTIQKVVLV